MPPRQVNFVSSLQSTALADQWTPPRVKPQFEGLAFRRYNMSPETRLEFPGGDLGDCNAGDYERAFAGVENTIEELSAMFDEDWAKNQAPASGLSTTTRSDEEEVDQLMGDDSPSYDLGWAALQLRIKQMMAQLMILGGPHFQLRIKQVNDGPAYDLGWATVPDEEAADDGLVYDLGWTALPTEGVDGPDEPMDHQADVPAVDNTDDDGPAYDLGWGVSTSVDPTCPDVIKAYSDNDSSTHDLGSGDAPADPEVIDLTSDDGPTYDLGWDVRPASPLSSLPPSSSRLSPAPPSPGDMGDDINIKRASPLDDADEKTTDEMMMRINCRLKAIGNNMDDQHAHAIVQNAVHGLNYDRTPAHILMENRQLLG
ncbi:hypothetical protein P692DRAFT_20876415 [Suillus brevipes Sb2]|nr:hypothetical protein P692DRAFT_20876415 [Suillus brevipes Sb2]